MNEREAILAELNNEGAMYLQEDRYGDAVRIFKVAMALGIRLVNQTSQVGENLCVSDDDAEQNEDSFEKEAYMKMSQVRRRTQLGMSTNSQPTSPVPTKSTCEDCETSYMGVTSQDFIYREPIRLIDRYNLPSHAELILTIVFNMALSYHLKALSCDQKISKRHLVKAMKLYKLASVMESTHRIRLSPSHSIAMLNNVAQIYKAAGREEKAKKMFEKLLATIALIVDHGASSFVDKMDGFVQNVSHLILTESQIALAA